MLIRRGEEVDDDASVDLPVLVELLDLLGVFALVLAGHVLHHHTLDESIHGKSPLARVGWGRGEHAVGPVVDLLAN